MEPAKHLHRACAWETLLTHPVGWSAQRLPLLTAVTGKLVLHQFQVWFCSIYSSAASSSPPYFGDEIKNKQNRCTVGFPHLNTLAQIALFWFHTATHNFPDTENQLLALWTPTGYSRDRDAVSSAGKAEPAPINQSICWVRTALLVIHGGQIQLQRANQTNMTQFLLICSVSTASKFSLRYLWGFPLLNVTKVTVV